MPSCGTYIEELKYEMLYQNGGGGWNKLIPTQDTSLTMTQARKFQASIISHNEGAVRCLEKQVYGPPVFAWLAHSPHYFL